VTFRSFTNTLRRLALAACLGMVFAGPAGAEDRDVVHFAGGVARLTVCEQWVTSEVPQGRSVLLVLSPAPLPAGSTRPAEGVWLTFHAQPAAAELSHAKLTQRLAARIRLTAGDGARLHEVRHIHLGDWQGLRQSFTLPAAGRQGFHLLVPSEHGLLEWQAVFSSDRPAAKLKEIETILSSLTLHRPAEQPAPAGSTSASAALAFGAWKALRSRLRLDAAGGITIQFDRPGNYVIGGQGQVRFDDRTVRLIGRYQARDDLLLVTWNDGSRTNYRWRVSGGELFLTDHTGRVCQLRRIFE